ncbi:MAG: RICIN domain-containing protein [Archangium sp.]|nr:RICIN domain-containing protein [Archangium sp.]
MFRTFSSAVVLCAGLLSSGALADVYLQAKTGLFAGRFSDPAPWNARVQLEAFAGVDSQRFSFIPARGGSVKICQSSGHCLAVERGDAEKGVPVAVVPFTNLDSQLWTIETSSVAGYVRIRSRLGLYLDAHRGGARAGVPLWTWSFSTNDSQLWRMPEPATITPSSLGIHCPHAYDRHFPFNPILMDFDGRPWLTSSVWLWPSPDGRSIVATSTYDAWRTDVEEALHVVGRWDDVVFTAPLGRRIAGVPSGLVSNVAALASQAGPEFGVCADGDIQFFMPTGVVRQLRLIADTGSYDSSSDADCGCDAQFRGADFQPINIALE